MQTVEVDCQVHPCWLMQLVSCGSAVQGVSVPVHEVAVVFQLQPGVVHVACVLLAPQAETVPLQTPDV